MPGAEMQEVRLLDHIQWRPVEGLPHVGVLEEEGIVAYQELEEPVTFGAPGSKPTTRSRFIVRQVPLDLPSQKAPLDKPNPRLGVGAGPKP